MENPKIRPVEVIPVEDRGKTLFVVRDPMGHATAMVTVPPPVVWLLQFFDGNHSRSDIQEAFERQFHQALAAGQLGHIIENLDKALMLDSDRYHKHVEQMAREFRAAPVRAAAHAGNSYPKSPDELRSHLEGFYAAANGPGSLPQFCDGPGAREIKAVVAPHIDLRTGGPCFAHAYHAMARSPRPGLFVILGTGHAGLEHFFTATRKDFETPFGAVKTDVDFVDRLAARFGPELFEGELLHKTEHVIEFQTLFLRHLFGNGDYRIAPILCSYAFPQVDEDAFPEEAKTIRRFNQALAETIRETPGGVCAIASVDLAHIGPRYGDAQPVTPEQLAENSRADQRLIERLAAWDATGFLDLIRREQDARRICGFPCLHTMLASVAARSGEKLSYDCAAVDGSGSYVSFASMAFY